MLNLSDGVKKALILIPTQSLPAKTRVALRRKHLDELERGQHIELPLRGQGQLPGGGEADENQDEQAQAGGEGPDDFQADVAVDDQGACACGLGRRLLYIKPGDANPGVGIFPVVVAAGLAHNCAFSVHHPTFPTGNQTC